ncbi:MAG: hypothetical protein IKJ99_02165 [Oscillospiraceae bacterium]|nr:hypothetical protein [Oscillospiraceae bacterium]
MKKVFTLILTLLMIFSLFACGKGETELGPEVIEKKDNSRYHGIVHNPKAWYDEYMALPIANDQMTEQELRQLCVDTFRLNMTMPWTPNQPISYAYQLLGRTSEVVMPIGLAYSGMCYATGIKNATYGNPWKMLPYWDPETGVLDVEAMGEETLSRISSACAAGAQQGWHRVSDSCGLSDMANYSMYESNILPVGPYTYGPHTYNYNFVTRTATSEIIAANGNEVMYESLAQMKMADGLFSSPSWHVMMCSQDPVVVRYPDGTVDPTQSYLHVHEQGASGTRTDDHNYLQENGKTMRPLGTIDKKYTFQTLLEKGYIPFTLKEFTGEEPVEPGKAWVGSETAALENGKDMIASEIFTKNIYTNYSLCAVQVEVHSPDGTVLVCYNPNIHTRTNNASLMDCLLKDRVTPYANGKNTIHVYARLANGELVEAFNTLLKMQ